MEVQGYCQALNCWQQLGDLSQHTYDLDCLNSKGRTLLEMLHFPNERVSYENLSYNTMLDNGYVIILCSEDSHPDWKLAGEKAAMIKQFFMDILQNPSDTKVRPRVFAIMNSLNALKLDEQSFNRLMKITFDAISNTQRGPDSINVAFETILGHISSLQGKIPERVASALQRFKDGTLPGQPFLQTYQK